MSRAGRVGVGLCGRLKADEREERGLDSLTRNKKCRKRASESITAAALRLPKLYPGVCGASRCSPRRACSYAVNVACTFSREIRTRSHWQVAGQGLFVCRLRFAFSHSGCVLTSFGRVGTVGMERGYSWSFVPFQPVFRCLYQFQLQKEKAGIAANSVRSVTFWTVNI